MKKRIVSTILSACMLTMAFSGIEAATVIPNDNTTVLTEGNVALEEFDVLSNNEIILQSENSLWNYSLDDEYNATITGYTGSYLTALTIPSIIDGYTVTAIGGDSFKDKLLLESLFIPDTVTKIGAGAFQGCGNLANVKLSSNLETLGYFAFKDCSSLKSIYIPKSLKNITEHRLDAYHYHRGPFFDSGLETATFEEGTVSVANYLFYGATKLKNINLPDSITTISFMAFHGCSALESIVIPDTVTTICTDAFTNCTNLSSVKLSNNLETLEYFAFKNCSSLKSIYIPKSLTSTTEKWQGGATYYRGPFFNSGLETATLEEGTVSVANCLFYGATKLKNINWSDSITTISFMAFYGCSALESIVIPDTVITIGSDAFTDCTNLSSVKLSNNLDTLGYFAFKNCSLLKSIYIPKSLKNITEHRIDAYNYRRGPFFNSGLETATLEEGTFSVAYCLFYGATKLKNINLPDSITTISFMAFQGCSALESIVIPDTVTTICTDAFTNCTTLSSVKLSKNLDTLGYFAFKNCSSLKSIHIPKSLKNITEHRLDAYNYHRGPFFDSGLETATFEEGVTTLHNDLFHGASSLKEITVPDTVTSLGLRVFLNCTKLKSVQLPNTIKTLPAYTFSGCSSLEFINIPNSFTTIAEYSFNNCSSLTEAKISENVTSIGEKAFVNCTMLQNIILPNSITTLGVNVFDGCSSLAYVKLSENMKEIPIGTFRNCKNLKEISLPKTITTIRDSAFYGCTALDGITFHEGLSRIEQNSFRDCKTLTEIQIPSTVGWIGWDAFNNCDSLITADIDSTGEVGERVFYDCDSLETLTLGNHITKIWANMCYSCDNLKNVTLGFGITNIPDSAFRACQNLETITIPRYCTSISAYAFADNTNLKAAYIPHSVTNIQNNSFSYPDIMTIYGKAGSYAEIYANSKNFAFNAVNAPITVLSYPESKINIARNSTLMPNIQIIPQFDTDTVTFVSGDTNILTVSSNGTVTGKNYGTTTLTAISGSGLSDTVIVTVVRPADSITISNNSIELTVGSSQILTTTISPDTSDDIINWSSSDTNVVAVDKSGKVTAIGKGTAYITATAVYGNKSATCFVMVIDSNTPIVNVSGITLSPSELSITVGKYYTLCANVLPQNATNKLVIWTTSDSNVVDVENGVITAKSVGEATVTVKTISGGFAATCKITVTPKVEITSFKVKNYGEHDLLIMSAINVPTDNSVYFAAYDKFGRFMEVQSTVFEEENASAIFHRAGVSEYRAFIWKDDITPLSEQAHFEL